MNKKEAELNDKVYATLVRVCSTGTLKHWNPQISAQGVRVVIDRKYTDNKGEEKTIQSTVDLSIRYKDFISEGEIKGYEIGWYSTRDGSSHAWQLGTALIGLSEIGKALEDIGINPIN